MPVDFFYVDYHKENKNFHFFIRKAHLKIKNNFRVCAEQTLSVRKSRKNNLLK